MRRWIWLLVLLGVVACDSSTSSPTPLAFTLNLSRVAREEALQAELQGFDAERVRVFVAGQEVSPELRQSNRLSFRVPADAAAGTQLVELVEAGRSARQELVIFGDVDADRVNVVIPASVSSAELEATLQRQGFRLDKLSSLGQRGTCAASIADIDVAGSSLGEALAALEREEIVLFADPRSGYDIGPSSQRVVLQTLQAAGLLNSRNAIGADAAQQRGWRGEGVTIAVLDTGVSAHSELGERLLAARGFDFVNNRLAADDDFADPLQPQGREGHGTPIAILAAGETLGVAPSAQVLPLKVCDAEGRCLSSHIIRGICHALEHSPEGAANLVLNLSLGGDTPVAALEAVLEYAVSQGALVASAGGNEALRGSPRHYPAAFANPGLLAVAALEANPRPCVRFADAALGGRFSVDDSFREAGVQLSLEPLVLAGEPPFDQPPFRFGSAQVVGAPAGQALALERISLRAEFGREVGGVRLRLAPLSGYVTLQLDDERIRVEDADAESVRQALAELASVTVELLGETELLLTINRPLERFSIGGEALTVQGLCPILGNDADWQPAVFSTRGDFLDLAAPGVNLTSFSPDGLLFSGYEGTSYATPLLAGALALWREARPQQDSASIVQALRDSVRPLPFEASEVGRGLLSLHLAP